MSGQLDHCRIAVARARGSWIALTGIVLGLAAAVQAEPDPLEQLFADSATARSSARQRLLQADVVDLARMDPRRSGCLDGEAAPARCRNYAAYLAAVIDILAHVSARETAQASKSAPARDLLWALLFDPTVDPFAVPDAADADKMALRSQAERALRDAMALPRAPSRATAAAASIASTQDGGHAWFILHACAGNTQSSGCRYGSYLYAADGRLVSAASIEVGASDNPGGGIDEWTLALASANRLPRIGLAVTRGGFGGDVVRVIVRELGQRQRTRCGLTLSQTSDVPDTARLMGLLVWKDRRCSWIELPPGATPMDLGPPMSRSTPTPSLPAPSRR